MASRGTHPLNTQRSETQLLTARLKGAGAADMSVDDASEPGGGEIVSAVRSGAGTFNITFRHSYPKAMSMFRPCIMGTTTGLQARFTAWDAKAKTATVVFERADGSQANAGATAVATDPASADTVYFQWMVRNSNAN